MKYILTTEDNTILGPFTTIEQVDNGYMCDGDSYQTTATGLVTLSEVADDYINPQTILIEKDNYNKVQTKLRAEAYPTESDPVFFQWQAGSKTKEDWLAARDKVKELFPYKS